MDMADFREKMVFYLTVQATKKGFLQVMADFPVIVYLTYTY